MSAILVILRQRKPEIVRDWIALASSAEPLF